MHSPTFSLAPLMMLNPLTESQQSFWEIVNYALALLAVVGLGALWRWRRQHEQPIELTPPHPQPTKSESRQAPTAA